MLIRTLQAVEILAEHGFSAAMFGPAWPYEHFSNAKGDGRIAELVDKSMWEGDMLPDELHCECKDDRPHHQSQYRSSSIAQAAREFPAGSESYFISDFRRPFEFIVNQDLDREVRNQVPLVQQLLILS